MRARREPKEPAPGLLERVARFYRREFVDDVAGAEFLRERGLTDASAIERFGVGLSRGRLASAIPDAGRIVDDLRAAGLIDEGGEALAGCVVLPLRDATTRVVGFAGLPLDGGAIRHVGESAVVNWPALKMHAEVELVGDVLEALKRPDAVAIAGGWGSVVERTFAEFRPHRVRGAEGEMADRLHAMGIATDGGGLRVTPADTGFDVEIASRRYELRAVGKDGRRLRAVVRVVPRHPVGPIRQHVDHVDLYQARARNAFAAEAALALHEEAGAILGDLSRIIEEAEHWTPAAPTEPTMTDAERAEAMDLLRDPDLLERVLVDLDRLGLVGERTNKLAAYLVASSRKMDDPLSLLIMSRPAAGKSTLAEHVADLMPPEDVIRVTFLTGKALYYKTTETLSHKLLVIEEESGVADAAYPLRALLSAGRLALERPGKDRREVAGPIATILTTTRREVEPELQTRMLAVGIDESAEQTKAIQEIQRRREAGNGEDRGPIIALHRNAQRLLGHVPIVNPFAAKLTFTSRRLAARREHAKYLALIRAVAFVHQHSRPRPEVTKGDIQIAHDLAHEILGTSLQDVSAPARRVMEAMTGVPTFTKRQAAERLGTSYQHAAECVRELESLELVARRRAGKRLSEFEPLWDAEALQRGRVLLDLADPASL